MKETLHNANRYTFVWRGTLNYHLVGLLDMVNENEYNIGYDIPHAYMFVIGGMEKSKGCH